MESSTPWQNVSGLEGQKGDTKIKRKGKGMSGARAGKSARKI